MYKYMCSMCLVLNMIKGIVFDLDGTLFATEYYQWQGWVVPLKKYGVELTKAKYFDFAVKTGRDIEKEIARDFALSFKEGSLLKQKEKLLEKWFSTERIKLMPFAKEAVEYFNTNYKVGLCTGGPRDEALLKLERNDFLKYFESVTTLTDVERGKPFPDIYEKAVQRLGLNVSECLALEDTQYGVRSAKDAGLYCFAIPNEYSRKQDFSRADGVFQSLEEVVAFFEEGEC